MWLCLNNAFVSIVADTNPSKFKVRARKREHLERLFPGEKIIETKTTDYRYRVIVSRGAVGAMVSKAVYGIDYPNFKNSVAENGLHDMYSDFWVLHRRYQSAAAL